MAAKTSVDYRPFPTGQHGEVDKRRKAKRREKLDEFACALSMDHVAFRSRKPQRGVNTQIRTKLSADLEAVFRGAAENKPQISNPTEFHRIVLNQHWTCRTACISGAHCTAVVAYSLQATKTRRGTSLFFLVIQQKCILITARTRR